MSRLDIRPYVDATDREATLGLWQAVFAYNDRHNEPNLDLDRKLAVKDDLLFVARFDGQLVGSLMAGYDGHRGWIYRLAVHPAARRQKIGSRLLEYAEQELIRRGCVKINLQIFRFNEEVVKFYEQAGYRVEPRISMGKIVL